MPSFTSQGVKISGIASAVPSSGVALQPVTGMTSEELVKIVAGTGVKARHIAAPGTTTSDLCAAAAAELLQRVGWEKSSVDLLLFVSQTPDYVLPATACALHGRLGLAKTCAAFDINLGCSGYVYGLSVAAVHLQAGAAKRVLLLVGDTISKIVSPDDRSVAYLFGDAGTATVLEAAPDAAPMHFVTGSDGTGAAHLSVAAGMFRNPSTEQSRLVRERANGAKRSDEHLFMDGPEIFNFTIREIPPLVTRILDQAGWALERADGFVFHQANQFMLNYLIKRMKLPPGKAVLALEQYGNTSSASIPLALCDRYANAPAQAQLRLILAGFGVGFSWAASALILDPAVIFPVVEIPAS